MSRLVGATFLLGNSLTQALFLFLKSSPLPVREKERERERVVELLDYDSGHGEKRERHGEDCMIIYKSMGVSRMGYRGMGAGTDVTKKGAGTGMYGMG